MAADVFPLIEVRRRRWSQFTLRTLALAMLVACVGAAWLGARLRLVAERERAIAQLLSDGFTIAFADDEDLLSASAPSDSSQASWFGLRRVNSVQFGRADEMWRSCSSLGRAIVPDSLRTRGASRGLADRSVASILKLSEVRSLDLGCIRIEDRHLAQLSVLQSVERLDLAETRVTNAVIPILARFPRLSFLQIDQTKIDFDRLRRALDSFASERILCSAGKMCVRRVEKARR